MKRTHAKDRKMGYFRFNMTETTILHVLQKPLASKCPLRNRKGLIQLPKCVNCKEVAGDMYDVWLDEWQFPQYQEYVNDTEYTTCSYQLSRQSICKIIFQKTAIAAFFWMLQNTQTFVALAGLWKGRILRRRYISDSRLNVMRFDSVRGI